MTATITTITTGDASTPRYPYLLVRTAFHGGGVLSRHTRSDLADIAQAKYRGGDCTCGCAVVVLAADLDSLRDASDETSPYAAAS